MSVAADDYVPWPAWKQKRVKRMLDKQDAEIAWLRSRLGKLANDLAALADEEYKGGDKSA